MKEEYYPDIKHLTSQKQWRTYEKMIEDEVQRIFAIFKTDDKVDKSRLQSELIQTLKIQNMPLNLIKEHEESKQ